MTKTFVTVVAMMAVATPLLGLGKANVTATARRLDSQIQIDGKLNDLAWDKAKVISQFVQTEPDNMAAPTERTTVRLLYDDANLYVAIEAFDSQPQKITRRLARRDDFMGGFRGSADYVTVSLDSQHDHQSANGYLVNASGVQMDYALYNDSQYDGSWSAVWESAVSHNAQGWTIEMKIPFRDLKFTNGDEMVWGLSLFRYIQRKNETISWQPRIRGEQGIASLFGHLEGLSAIRPPEKIKAQPYVTSGPIRLSTMNSSPTIGFDATYRLGSTANVIATLNPDFGQVEADPAVVNLSAFETRFEEQRPFFVENSGLFQTPMELFYSRRIGVDSAPIVGAGKLIGKTAGGISYAMVAALSSLDEIPEHKGMHHHSGNDLIGRVQKDILAGNSSLGFLGTWSGGRGGSDPKTVGADWRLNLRANQWSNVGQVVMTSTGGVTGTALENRLQYQGPKWKSAGLRFRYYDANVDFDDLGFMNRNDFLGISGELSARRQDPIGKIRRAELRVGEAYRQNLSGNTLEQQYRLDADATFLNYWQIRMGLRLRPAVFNDDRAISEDSEGAPIYKTPGTRGGYVGFDTDGRKALALGIRMRGGKDDLDATRISTQVNFSFRPATFMQGSLSVDVSRRENPVQYITLMDSGPGTGALFAWTTTQTVETTVRFEANLNPNISFQVFGQMLDARIEYDDYRTLDKALTGQFTSYDASSRTADAEDYLTMRGTAVLRWEMRPGEIFFLVYSLDRREDNLPTEVTNNQAVFIKYNMYLTR